jgi:tetratricopeptide (TPR) repeat protein
VVSPLPPPVTRGLYRSHWFEFLNAHLEDDERGATAALAELKKAARAVGVRRLSDFSRTAVQEGKKAEAIGNVARASRAYSAALELDDANFAGLLAKSEFLLRRRSYRPAAAALAHAVRALFASRESRLSVFSAATLWAAAGVVLATVSLIVLLLVRHFGRLLHDARERAARFGDRRAAIPLLAAVLLVPFAVGLGPIAVVVCWAALLLAYTEGRERAVLIGALFLLGIVCPAVRLVSRENILERSPLYVAALDLAEQREDGSAEDGLRQASAVFSEDGDVWFLLGIYAERAGDSDRAVACYDRAIQANPGDYRPLLNRGNVRFQEGDFLDAIRDYDAAVRRAPRAAEAYYNLSIARGDSYDFDGQGAALAKAREISDRQVTGWSDNPTLARVVSAPYPLSRARRKIEQWNAQPKSRRLPGHAPPISILGLLATPLTAVAWGALAAGVGLAVFRSDRSIAVECVRCGKLSCRDCRRAGDPPLYCGTCARTYVRKEPIGIEAQVAQSSEARRRSARRDAACHVSALLLPGAHSLFSGRPVSAFLALAAFFFCLSVAVVADRLFDARQLPPPGGTPVIVVSAIVAAVVIWAVGLLSSWRHSHGA